MLRKVDLLETLLGFYAIGVQLYNFILAVAGQARNKSFQQLGVWVL